MRFTIARNWVLAALVTVACMGALGDGCPGDPEGFVLVQGIEPQHNPVRPRIYDYAVRYIVYVWAALITAEHKSCIRDIPLAHAQTLFGEVVFIERRVSVYKDYLSLVYPFGALEAKMLVEQSRKVGGIPSRKPAYPYTRYALVYDKLYI